MHESGGRFAHPLPFGAGLTADGSVRFRLWAPGQHAVALWAEAADTRLPMQPAGDGWFELETDTIGRGDPYRYELSDGMKVPDPASRGQAGDVHGPSLVIDPRSYRWRHPQWQGRPWHEAVLSEVHVGTASPEGTWEGLRHRLEHWADTGFTAIELMPLAAFSGTRGWGYDGVLPFSPARSYGTPDDLKRLVDEAHGLGLMMFLDVVYNHFGPDGNYLHAYAPQFFDPGRQTPWGPGIDFTRREVREFFIHNALYWLAEYRFDGLRFDAVDQIADPSDEHILEELARRVRAAIPDRHVHLVLENDKNSARLLERDGDAPRWYTAQWNDDYHHAVHVALTGESDGYYCDYAVDPPGQIARALAEGFIYQGQRSPFRDDRPRGEPSAGLPTTAFVSFIQNHDQVGNRALGERLTVLADDRAVEAALVLLLLSPQVPLLFMGEEWGETQPFWFFCDFHDELAAAVRQGRRSEFRRFERFRSPEARAEIPDPNAPATMEGSRLDWSKVHDPHHGARLALVRRLLEIRSRAISPLLDDATGNAGHAEAHDGVIHARWQLAGGATLKVVANLQPIGGGSSPDTAPLFAWPESAAVNCTLPPWSVVWTLDGRS